MDFTSEFYRLTQEEVRGKQRNTQTEREKGKRKVQFRLTHFHEKNKVFFNR